jgi:hypothetical protein
MTGIVDLKMLRNPVAFLTEPNPPTASADTSAPYFHHVLPSHHFGQIFFAVGEDR